MYKIGTLIAIGIFFTAAAVFAEDLVPATSEDQQAFDQEVAPVVDSGSGTTGDESEDVTGEDGQGKNHGKKGHVKKARKANFGLIVSTEAKRLKDEPQDQKKEMGSWVSNQRRKNTGSAGGHGSSNDGRSSSPKLNNSGGSSNSPGQSGNHKK